MRACVGLLGFVLLFGFAAGLSATPDIATRSYPAPTVLDQFRFAAAADEIAMARSAAPASVSADAEILSLGREGYETAVKGNNGFVCLVERSWANAFDSGEFWNPKMRAPICFNLPAAKSVLPVYLQRTQWVLAGVPKDEMVARTRAAVANHTAPPPLPNSMSFMMSKQGYLNDGDRHWYAHIMFFLSPTEGTSWGANLHGVPVFSDTNDLPPLTTFFVLVPKWSDGSLVFPQ